MEKKVNKRRNDALCIFGISTGIFLLGVIEWLTLLDFTYAETVVSVMKICIQLIPYVIMTVWLAVDKHKNRETNPRRLVRWALLGWGASMFVPALFFGGHLQPIGVVVMLNDMYIDSSVFESVSIYIIFMLVILIPYLKGRTVQVVAGILSAIYATAIIYQVVEFISGEHAVLFWCILLLANIGYYIGIILCACDFSEENSSGSLWGDFFTPCKPEEEYDEYTAYGDEEIPPLFRITKEEYKLICERRIERFERILSRMNEESYNDWDDWDDELTDDEDED